MADEAVTAVTATLDAPPVAPALWQGTLDGLPIGPGTPYSWRRRDGFEELPAVRATDEARPWAHGTWSGDEYAGGRTLSLAWKVRPTPTVTYQEALDALSRIMVPGRDIPLWVNLPRRGLVRWLVRVRRWRVPVDALYDVDLVVDAECELYAPDPVGYGPGVVVSTGFAQPGGGLEFPLFDDTGVLEFGSRASSGRVTVTNAGAADSWPVLRIAGPVADQGFEVVDVESGRRLRYVGGVPDGSHLDIDTATASVVLDDVADRSGLLTIRQWSPVPAGGPLSLAFLPLGPVSPPSWKPGAALRRNLVTDPRATNAALWNPGWSTGGAGTETPVAGAADGPVLPDGTRVGTYMRYTTTTTPTHLWSWFGFHAAGVNPAEVWTAGTNFAVSIYVRASVPVAQARAVAQGRLDDTVVPAFSHTAPPVSLPAGRWVRLSMVQPLLADIDIAEPRVSIITTSALSAGATIDVTCAMAEPGATEVGPYLDGGMTSGPGGVYEWDGAPNASSSTQYAPVPTPQATLTVAHADAWW